MNDLFVEWYPLMFGSSFIITLLVSEARKRGHLRSNREAKRSEVIGLLIVLGFNFLVAGPIVIIGILLEYTVGAPSFLVVVMYAVMTLGELIPLLLSGMLSYLALSAIYENWGISFAAAVSTAILLLLTWADYIGWLQPSLPYVLDMVGSFVQAQFGFLIMIILISMCIGKYTSSSAGTDKKETRTRMKLASVSLESGLRLLVGLGRRIVNDADEDALEALRIVYSSNSFSKKSLSLAGKEIDVDLESALSSSDIRYSQQLLEAVNGRFGKLEKRNRNVIVAFLIISVISAVLTVAFFTARVFAGTFLLIPAIILPVISGFIHQQTSRYDKGRFASPSVTQYNSFLLSNREFRARVNRDRAIFSLSLLSLLGIITGSALKLTPSYLVWGGIAIIILSLAAILSTSDRTLASERLKRYEIVERGLKLIGATGEDGVLEDQAIPIKAPSEESYSESHTTPLTSEDWRERLERRGHSEFARIVANHGREAYTETSKVILYMVLGGMLVLMGVLTYFMFTEFEFLTFMLVLPIGCVIIGFPLLLFGTYNHLKTRNSTRFFGLQRKSLTILISYYDRKAQGVTDFGEITDSDTPSEYAALGLMSLFMPGFIRSAIIKLRGRVPWPKEEMDKAWRTRSSYPKLEIIALLISAVLFVLMFLMTSSFEADFFPRVFLLFLLGSIGLFVLIALFSILTYYKERRLLREILGQLERDAKVTHRVTADTLLDLLQSEFNMPLRVLLVGNYPQAIYTGRSHFTTSGIEVREAVIIPSGIVLDSY